MSQRRSTTTTTKMRKTNFYFSFFPNRLRLLEGPKWRPSNEHSRSKEETVIITLKFPRTKLLSSSSSNGGNSNPQKQLCFPYYKTQAPPQPLLLLLLRAFRSNPIRAQPSNPVRRVHPNTAAIQVSLGLPSRTLPRRLQPK